MKRKQRKTNPARLILKSAKEIAKTYPSKFKPKTKLSEEIDKIVYSQVKS